MSECGDLCRRWIGRRPAGGARPPLQLSRPIFRPPLRPPIFHEILDPYRCRHVYRCRAAPSRTDFFRCRPAQSRTRSRDRCRAAPLPHRHPSVAPSAVPHRHVAAPAPSRCPQCSHTVRDVLTMPHRSVRDRSAMFSHNATPIGPRWGPRSRPTPFDKDPKNVPRGRSSLLR